MRGIKRKQQQQKQTNKLKSFSSVNMLANCCYHKLEETTTTTHTLPESSLDQLAQ